MKILIDDICKTITRYSSGDIVLHERNPAAYMGHIVRKILTPEQFEIFIGDDTKRIFTLMKDQKEILLKIAKELEEEK